METILSWTSLPNLHPALVHLPIGMLPMALLFDTLGLFKKSQEWFAHAATTLYTAAAVTGGVALWAGERAADGLVGIPAGVQLYIAKHSDWAHYATWTLVGVVVLRLALSLWERKSPGRRSLAFGLRASILVAAFAGLGLLGKAADLGGALVYEHAVAVNVDTNSEDPSGAPASSALMVPEEVEGVATRLLRGSDGALHWQPLPTDTAALGSLLTPIGENRHAAVDEERGLGLRLSGESLLVLEGTFGDVQVEATIELGSFKGTFGLLHHVADAATAGAFLVSTTGETRLEDWRGGQRKVLDEGTVEPGSSLNLAVSAAGRHLKGFSDGRTVVHGHIAPGDDGACGLYFNGEGTLRVVALKVIPLTEH